MEQNINFNEMIFTKDLCELYEPTSLLFSFEQEQYEASQMSYEFFFAHMRFLLVVSNKYLVFEFGAHALLTHHCHHTLFILILVFLVSFQQHNKDKELAPEKIKEVLLKALDSH